MPTTLLAAVVALITGFASPHAATWKETQTGGWERTCHDGGSTACTVWDNPTKQVMCRACAETPYKVQPPVPGEPVVKVQQQPHHITADEMISYQISESDAERGGRLRCTVQTIHGHGFHGQGSFKASNVGGSRCRRSERGRIKPSDSVVTRYARHCRTTTPEDDTTCFEGWLYTNLEAELPSVVTEKGSQRTKTVTTDRTGRENQLHTVRGWLALLRVSSILRTNRRLTGSH